MEKAVQKILLLLSLLFLSVASAMPAIQTGADQLDLYLPLIKNKKVGLLVNQTSRIGKQHIIDVLLAHHVDITKIFVPEHGLLGQEADGVVIKNSRYRNIPVISLYGKKTKPDAADLKDVEILIFDIQDVGVRFYTYTSSLQRLMEAALEHHKPLIVLDRPNPNGFYVDGPVSTSKSFTGLQPVPVVYGMTVGEYAKMLVGENWLEVKPKSEAKALQLIVIPNRYYTHQRYYEPPVPPSPNLPDILSIYWYPAIGLLEGTVMSVGRGTDKPFQVFGHPDIKATYTFIPRSRPGAKNPLYENQICHGWNLTTSRSKTLAMINQQLQIKYYLLAYNQFPDKKHFFPGKLPKMRGKPVTLGEQVRAGMSEAAIRASWEPRLSEFKKIRKRYLLYPDATVSNTLPPGFVYLRDVDPSIMQDIRYAGSHNFVGHPLPGYAAGQCILTVQAAKALALVQKKLKPFSLSLKVYDCYRPTRTVDAFMAWSREKQHQEMKKEFYPNVDKADFFKLGYVARKSGHSRGSTVDVTLVSLPAKKEPVWHQGQRLVSCTAPVEQRFPDNTIDMGTGYDCLNERAYPDNKQVSVIAQRHRKIFQELMMANDFLPYEKEWWHFTLKNEPFPNHYFNFEVK